uniref:MATH domain-containing protein n=2 Tax=Caenorhabditis tropicalis TaxID=1561998 RepID=A0A1I7TGQ1_9PELO
MSGATDSDSSTNLRTAEASAEVLQTANDFADICKNISEKQNEQSELNVKVLEKLQAIQNDLNEIKIKLKDDTIFVRDRKTDSIISKSFVMKQIFENVLEVENEKWFNGKLEEHFGVQWQLRFYRKNEHISFRIVCATLENMLFDCCVIETELQAKLLSNNKNDKLSEVRAIFDSEKSYLEI